MSSTRPCIGPAAETGSAGKFELLLAQGRQPDVEGRAAAELRLHLDVALVPFHDGIHGGETEAAALLLGGEVGVEDLRQMLRLDARAGVGHGNADVIPGHGTAGATRWPGVSLRARMRMIPPSGMAWTALMTRFCTTWPIWPLSASAGQRSAGKSYSHFTREPCRANSATSRDDLRQPDRGADRIAALGEGEQLLGQVPRPQGGPLGLPQVVLDLGQLPGVEQGQGDVAHDHRQDVVEVVGDAAGEDADRFQLRGARASPPRAARARSRRGIPAPCRSGRCPPRGSGRSTLRPGAPRRRGRRGACAAADGDMVSSCSTRANGPALKPRSRAPPPGWQISRSGRPTAAASSQSDQLHGGAVHELHHAPGVRGDHALGHRAQRHRQPLLFLRQRQSPPRAGR